MRKESAEEAVVKRLRKSPPSTKPEYDLCIRLMREKRALQQKLHNVLEREKRPKICERCGSSRIGEPY